MDDCVRMLRMAGKKKEEINTIMTVKIGAYVPLNVQRFYQLWDVFNMDPAQFINYMLTRIQV